MSTGIRCRRSIYFGEDLADAGGTEDAVAGAVVLSTGYQDFVGDDDAAGVRETGIREVLLRAANPIRTLLRLGRKWTYAVWRPNVCHNALRLVVLLYTSETNLVQVHSVSG